jgi:hypothetical protein
VRMATRLFFLSLFLSFFLSFILHDVCVYVCGMAVSTIYDVFPVPTLFSFFLSLAPLARYLLYTPRHIHTSCCSSSVRFISYPYPYPPFSFPVSRFPRRIYLSRFSSHCFLHISVLSCLHLWLCTCLCRRLVRLPFSLSFSLFSLARSLQGARRDDWWVVCVALFSVRLGETGNDRKRRGLGGEM